VIEQHPIRCKPPLVYSRNDHGCIGPRRPSQEAKCEPPMTYSRKTHGCIGPKHPPIVANCEPPMVYSRKEHGCVGPKETPKVTTCEDGMVYSRKAHDCIKPHGPVVVIPVPETPVLEPVHETPPPEPVHATPTPEPAHPLTPVPAVQTAAVDRCLSQDLYHLLSQAYGHKPGLDACASSCLPKPASYTPAKLDELTKSDGVNWCDDCIDVGSYMPLDAVLKIEKAAHLTLCARPVQCVIPSSAGKRLEIRTLFKDLPAGVKNEGNLAVVVGNETYQGDVPANADGTADADAVEALLTDQLGYRKENIIDLRNASLADFERVFGSNDNPGGEIAKRIDKSNPGDVFVYVASHGMVKEDDAKQAYLLPVDAKIDHLDDTAYGLQKLYDNLSKTGARTTMLVLEATFAKNLDELIDPPNLPELEVEAMPVNPVPGLAVFKASDRDQRTIQDPEYGIGLFTRYMIEGLAGRADEPPLGNGDKRIDTVELYVYTADAVRTAARKSFGLEQKPLLSKIDNLVVGNLAEK
jgi:hypothetical protein